MPSLSPLVALPGGLELTPPVVLAVVFTAGVYADATRRDDEYAANWGITVFLTTLFWIVPGIAVLGLYHEMR